MRWISPWLPVVTILAGARVSPMQLGPRHADGILVPTNQLLQPVGQRIEFSGSPVDLAISPDSGIVAVSVSNRVALYTPSGKLLQTLQLPAVATYAGLAFSPDGQRLAVSHVSGVTLFWVSAPFLLPTTVSVPDRIPCGLTFDPVRPFLYVTLNSTNLVARIDLNRGSVDKTVPVGIAPVGVAITPNGGQLFVSNWGGRVARPGDTTATSSGSRVVVDERGIAASGTVSVINLTTFANLRTVEVGLHPSGIRASPDGTLVAVANANSDSVSLMDPVSLAVTSIVSLPAFPQQYLGSSPTALAFSGDSSRLYVTCAGNNSVASLVHRNGAFEVANLAPADWYPIAIAVSSSPSGDTIFVANAKGVGSRAGNAPFSATSRLGTLSRIDTATPGGSIRSAEKPISRARVAALNNPFQGVRAPEGSPSDMRNLGIRHVFFIVKENRTYDQILGDLAYANGDPRLAIYGSHVTPNHHLLASQFVTLDNFYATGVVSAEGHQWITQAMATDYIERSYSAGWPRSYPYSGEDALAFATSGFIWDNALHSGLSVRIFGEFTLASSGYSRSWAEYLQDAQLPQMRYATPSRSTVASIANIIERDFPAFALNVPDQFRARIFLDKFNQYVAQGAVPNLVIVWLPADHTAGTTPNMPAPQTMVADNDLALGRIVEAISHSLYWPQSAIFVVEDDAQDGVDHVDGHRTICLVASPYTRRGVVDSTSYNQTSVVRTIEDLLSMPPMNKFDAAALPMRSVFTTTPDFTPYFAAQANLQLAAMNPDAGSLKGRQRKAALDSMKMDFSIPDAAPEQKLNRILWGVARGWNTRYPKPPHRRDCEMDDDDR